MLYDGIVVGAGITGVTIARELSRYKGNFLVLDKGEDVCTGASRANTAIMHGGYDAAPGSLKALMNVRGVRQVADYAKQLNFPFRQTGTLVLCHESEDEGILKDLYNRGLKNGLKAEELTILSGDEARSLEPNVKETVKAALYCKIAGIVDPFLMTTALAENAAANGLAFLFNKEVTRVSETTVGFRLETESGEIFQSRSVVNAAGLYADELHNRSLPDRKPYRIRARRGEYLLLDKAAAGFVRHPLFPLPTAKGKGIMIAPTIDGNTLVGPTSDFQRDKGSLGTTAAGLAEIQESAGHYVDGLPLKSVIRSFAGLRAHEMGGDFVLVESLPGFFNCIGIESPGLTSCFAIGQDLANRVGHRLGLVEKADFIAGRKPFPKVADLDFEDFRQLADRDRSYAHMVCRCEKVTEAEIVAAIHQKPGATTLDGIKRRVRAMAGRCQGGFCLPKVINILARELDIPREVVCKNIIGSNYILGDLKGRTDGTGETGNREKKVNHEV